MYDSVSPARPPGEPGGNVARGLAIAALILGLVACGLFFTIVPPVACGLLAVLLAIVYLVRGGREARAQAWWGLGLGAVGLLLALGTGVLLIVLGNYFGGLTLPQSMPESVVGTRVPEFTLETLDGAELSASDLRGQPVLIDVWATWCGPCLREIPHLKALRDRVAEDELLIVGISPEEAATVEGFAEEHEINYRLAATDLDALPRPLSEVQAFPTKFVLDADGIVRAAHTGGLDEDGIHALVAGAVGPACDCSNEECACPAYLPGGVPRCEREGSTVDEGGVSTPSESREGGAETVVAERNATKAVCAALPEEGRVAPAAGG